MIRLVARETKLQERESRSARQGLSFDQMQRRLKTVMRVLAPGGMRTTGLAGLALYAVSLAAAQTPIVMDGKPALQFETNLMGQRLTSTVEGTERNGYSSTSLR